MLSYLFMKEMRVYGGNNSLGLKYTRTIYPPLPSQYLEHSLNWQDETSHKDEFIT